MSLKPGPIPKYHQLTELLRECIFSGQYNPGGQLPTEDEICKEYRVSRGTARRAISTLIQEGLIRSEQGRGTFVNSRQTAPAHLTLTRFNEEMLKQHRHPSTRVLVLEVTAATQEVVQRLALNPDEPVIHIVRLRLANNQPVIYETRYLAQSLCPGLVYEDLETESIHHLLVYKYHLPLIRTIHTIEAHSLRKEEAEIMRAPVGTATFSVDRLTYTIGLSGEQPAVWYQAIYKGDEYQFTVEFEARS